MTSTDGDMWMDISKWYLKICESLNILLKRNIEEEHDWIDLNYIWNRTEGDLPVQSQYCEIHQDTSSIRRFLDANGHKYYKAGIGRVGLIFGDFRVADHGAHGELIKKAKIAVGKKGTLIVVTPTKKTILATTQKTECWEDFDRFGRLSTNRLIDHLMMADMPEMFYEKPSLFWANIWNDIHPDLIFLGEEKHPLQTIYEEQCNFLGGILLIDPKPVVQRSGDLIKIK